MADLTDIDTPSVIPSDVPSTVATARRAEMFRTRRRLAGSISDARALGAPSRLLSDAAGAAREKLSSPTALAGVAALAAVGVVAAMIGRRLRRRAVVPSWRGRVMSALVSGVYTSLTARRGR